MAPDTTFTAVWWLLRKPPTVPASAPMATNTAVKPSTKPAALASVRLGHRSPPPAKYDTYTGSMGSRHGEMKVMIPSRNEIRYCIPPLLSGHAGAQPARK